MMLKGGGGAFGEDDPEGKGCAWNVLDCQLTQEVVVTLTLRSSSGKGHTKGAMPGTGGDQKEATVRSLGKRKKQVQQKTLEDMRLQTTCTEQAHSEPLQYAGRFRGHDKQGPDKTKKKTQRDCFPSFI